ncbi:MAG: hypothetical protein SF053_06095 [Bacteroidia bacterium]|nr:hypothetical protein [Bacteroidia bacterium]
MSPMGLSHPESYAHFRDTCSAELDKLQEAFIKRYAANTFSEWHYNDDLGVFILKFQAHCIYFRSVIVGSYSNNTYTWKWSWDNPHISEKEKTGMDQIPIFGESHGYEDLTTGLIAGDQRMGWEMTAIANTFIQGMGAFRVQMDHLDMYFLFIAEIDDTTYTRLSQYQIICDTHGAMRRAFVCQHLKPGEKNGFHEAFPTYQGMELQEDDDFQAWCDTCENVREAYEGWNEDSEKFAKIRLICEACYFAIKTLNAGGLS